MSRAEATGRAESKVWRASAPVFAALGDETRLRLLSRLATRGPLSIAHLSADESVTRQAITKHLRVLADVGLVHDQRLGRECLWRVDTSRLEETRQALERISRQWDAALDRLKAFVEE
jgi:DNA-binding transcriptional ArsR family regulator